ncbi:MAG: signal peptidase II [Acidimicrobiales bacterium]
MPLVGAGLVAADQLAKEWALHALDDGPVDLVWTLRLKLHFNSGTAFSLAAGRGGIVALLGLVVVLVLFRSVRRMPGRVPRVALGLVLGGAVGNLADRAFRAGDGFLGGRVVDFIDLQWWPVFNLADMGIVIGAGLLVLASSRDDERDEVASQ